MKKLVLFSLIALTSYGCLKNEPSGCQPVPVQSEKAPMVAFCTARNISYTEHSSGLLYQIMDPGQGTLAPAASSIVTVQYVGKLMNGTTFDSSSTPFTSGLSQLIDGWKIGLPLIKKGGKIKLVIPSALGYSCTGSPPIIPANSPLYFEISLVDLR
ncbi:MAG: FKBP-type peptidyl-prolyl cis-trans isomerase [Bacteroidota bacterium]